MSTPLPTQTPFAYRPVRRLVTGCDTQGRSMIVSDGPTPNVFKSQHAPNIAQVVWSTDATPAPCDGASDPAPADKRFGISPPAGGTILRIVDFPPDTEYDPAEAARFLDEVGGGHARDTHNPRHFLFHKTSTLDYALVLEGEIWALMDEGESLMRAGDVLIQCATNHSWSNRSGAICRMAFVLIDGAPSA